VLKEFALQDAGMLGGTQAALEYGLDEPIVDDFPLNDQEILVRHLHHEAVKWVGRYQAETTPVGV
jgi:Rieske 2Fe-2S family protein